MTLEEANSRLKNEQLTTEKFLQIGTLYILLDLDKDDFCKIVDAVGAEKLIEKDSYYRWLLKAADELKAKERYLTAKRKLEDLEDEKKELEDIITEYEKTAVCVKKITVSGTLPHTTWIPTSHQSDFAASAERTAVL